MDPSGYGHRSSTHARNTLFKEKEPDSLGSDLSRDHSSSSDAIGDIFDAAHNFIEDIRVTVNNIFSELKLSQQCSAGRRQSDLKITTIR